MLTDEASRSIKLTLQVQFIFLLNMGKSFVSTVLWYPVFPYKKYILRTVRFDDSEFFAGKISFLEIHVLTNEGRIFLNKSFAHFQKVKK